MHLREETNEVTFTKRPIKQSFEFTFKYVEGVEPNVQLVRPSLFAEMAKAKKKKVETFEDAVSSVFPCLMHAASEEPASAQKKKRRKKAEVGAEAVVDKLGEFQFLAEPSKGEHEGEQVIPYS